MILISQDKKQIINFENVTRIFIDAPEEDDKYKKYYIGADTNSAESMVWELGQYETETRAREILIEISVEFKRVLLSTQSRGTGEIKFCDVPKVYYMPEK